MQFIPGRLIQTIPVVFGVTLVVFFLGHLLPGDPAIAILGEHATPARVAALREQLGLNLPLGVQYGQFLLHILQGNLGQSLTYQVPVASLVLQAVPVTLSLLLFALIISLAISIPLAGLAAAKPGGAWDYVARGYTLLGQGMPQFWVGIMLLLLLAVGLRVFPVGGYGITPLDHIYYLCLPALTMGIAMSPTIVRSLRSSTIDVLGSEYIATARSKGSSGTALFRQHVLRNAVIPTVSIIGAPGVPGWRIDRHREGLRHPGPRLAHAERDLLERLSDHPGRVAHGGAFRRGGRHPDRHHLHPA
jgi:peptide/nickel transport system permease protein